MVTETFGTMAADLLALRDWLQAYGVTHVALESTGVYWKPVYYVLEDAFTLLLINMQRLKHVPGRKTDVRDSEWLAQLLECGLLRASFVPPPPIRELRDLTRYRLQQMRDRAQEVNRLCKVLEDSDAQTDQRDDRCDGRQWPRDADGAGAGHDGPGGAGGAGARPAAQELPELRRALPGHFRRHHAFLVEQILAKIDYLDEALERLNDEIDERLVPFEPMLTRWTPFPAEADGRDHLFAETGGDMRRFPTAGHLCSWGAMCPGQNESAGKRRSGKTREATGICGGS